LQHVTREKYQKYTTNTSMKMNWRSI